MQEYIDVDRYIPSINKKCSELSFALESDHFSLGDTLQSIEDSKAEKNPFLLKDAWKEERPHPYNEFFATVCKNQRELKMALSSGNPNINISTLVHKFSIDAGVDAQAETEKYGFSIVTKIQCLTGVQTFTNTTFSEEALQLIENKQWETFYNRYGDYYVSQIFRGSLLKLTIKVATSSKNVDVDDFINISATTPGKSPIFPASLKGFLHKLSQKYSLEYSLERIGGPSFDGSGPAPDVNPTAIPDNHDLPTPTLPSDGHHGHPPAPHPAPHPQPPKPPSDTAHHDGPAPGTPSTPSNATPSTPAPSTPAANATPSDGSANNNPTVPAPTATPSNTPANNTPTTPAPTATPTPVPSGSSGSAAPSTATPASPSTPSPSTPTHPHPIDPQHHPHPPPKPKPKPIDKLTGVFDKEKGQKNMENILDYCTKFCINTNETNEANIRAVFTAYRVPGLSQTLFPMKKNYDDVCEEVCDYLTVQNALINAKAKMNITEKALEADSYLQQINEAIRALKGIYDTIGPWGCQPLTAVRDQLKKDLNDRYKNPQDWANLLNKFLLDLKFTLKNKSTIVLKYLGTSKDDKGERLYIGPACPKDFEIWELDKQIKHHNDRWAPTLRYDDETNLVIELVEHDDGSVKYIEDGSRVYIVSAEECVEHHKYLSSNGVWDDDKLADESKWTIHTATEKTQGSSAIQYGDVISIVNHKHQHLSPGKNIHGVHKLDMSSKPHYWAVLKPRKLPRDHSKV